MAGDTSILVNQQVDLLQAMVNLYENKGYTSIRVDIKGYSPPGWEIRVNSHYVTPDLTCFNTEGNMVILKVLTCDGFLEAENEEKWKVLYTIADKFNGEFHIAAPRFCMGKASNGLVERHLLHLRIPLQKVAIWTPI